MVLHKKLYWRFAVSMAGVLLGSASLLAQTYREAPQLAELVAAGKLPPVGQRLPAQPEQVRVASQIGTYGGEWNEYIGGPAEQYKISRLLAYENLVRWNEDFTAVEPNVAESFEVSEDGKEFIFHIRPGIRWSDGAAFTADDIVFAMNDVLNDPELSPAGPPGWLKGGGEAAKVEKIDAHTVRISFIETQGLFLQRLAMNSGHALTHFPRHYLEQFHKKYNPGGIDALVAASGLGSWTELFTRKRWIDSFADNTDVPVLYAWKLATPFGGGGTRLVFDRNPYYWKVDEDGNQLPYIDRVAFEIIQDVELSGLRMMRGDLDSLLLGDDAAAVLSSKAVFNQNSEQGDYRFVDVEFPGPFRIVALNLTHPDPAKRAVFANKDFRIGLSHAIDRQEIIDLLYFGQGEATQAAPDRASRYYDEEFAKQYTEHDPDLANQYLDKVLPQKDAEGFRLMPDGERLTITFEMIARPDDVDLFELLLPRWAEVGIDARINSMDRSLRDTRLQANEPDGFTWGGSNGSLGDELLDPRWYAPVMPNASYYAVPWVKWHATDGNSGEEPPEQVKAQMASYDQAMGTPGPDKQVQYVADMLKIAKEQFYLLGISTRGGGYAIVSNKLKNVPDKLLVGPGFFRVAVTHPEQYYLEGE